jgi:hypothetical protein
VSKPTPGIMIRHARSCPAYLSREAACSCKPAYQASVYDQRAGKRVRRHFRTLAAAKVWRQDALPALRRGTMRAPSQTTLRAAWEEWKAGADAGTIRTRSGDRFKPSTLRGYAQAMERILGDLGAVKLSDITRRDVQRLVDRMLGDGADPSTIRNAVMLRVIFRRAIEDGDIAVNPCSNLRLPAVRGRRDRIASPSEAAALIAALDNEHDKAVWAVAFYAGLRLGSYRRSEMRTSISPKASSASSTRGTRRLG